MSVIGPTSFNMHKIGKQEKAFDPSQPIYNAQADMTPSRLQMHLNSTPHPHTHTHFDCNNQRLLPFYMATNLFTSLLV